MARAHSGFVGVGGAGASAGGPGGRVGRQQILPDAIVQNLDVLEMTNRLFRRVYGSFYLDLVNKAPHVLGYFYDLLDQPSVPARIAATVCGSLVEKLNLQDRSCVFLKKSRGTWSSTRIFCRRRSSPRCGKQGTRPCRR